MHSTCPWRVCVHTSDAGLATIKTINIGTYTHFSELEHSPSTLKHLHMHAHTHALGEDTNCYSCLPALALPPRSQGCQSAELQAPPSRSPSQSSPQISGSGQSAGCHWQRPRLRGWARPTPLGWLPCHCAGRWTEPAINGNGQLAPRIK